MKIVETGNGGGGLAYPGGKVSGRVKNAISFGTHMNSLSKN